MLAKFCEIIKNLNFKTQSHHVDPEYSTWLMEIDVSFLEEQRQKELASEFYNWDQLLRICERVPEDENVLNIKLYADQKIQDILEQIDPKYLPYKYKGGEVDLYNDITSATTISEVEDSGYDGPRYASGALFNQQHVDARWHAFECLGRLREDEDPETPDYSDIDESFVRREAYQPQVYYKRGEWHSNIRILCDGNKPLYVSPDWEPEVEEEVIALPVMTDSDELEISEVTYVKKVMTRVPVRKKRGPLYNHDLKWKEVVVDKIPARRVRRKKVPLMVEVEGYMVPAVKYVKKVIRSGIPFHGSKQLAPKPGCAYSDKATYSIIGVGASILKARFEARLREGRVKTCI
ncbi:MAG: hypothetical protein D6732_09465, partial [Methanobacteriota archaeon]